MSKKKSARSKGYQSYESKKKAKAQKETRTMIIGIVVFAVILIGVLVGVKVYDNWGTLKVKDNVIQNVEDSWILKNVGTTSKPKVYKMAEMTAPVEGYTQKALDRNIQQWQYNIYNADDENAKVSKYTVSVATGNYDEAPDKVRTSISSMGDTIAMSEVQMGEIAGQKVGYFSRNYSMDISEDQDGSDIRFYQSLYAYFEAKFSGYSILISVGDEVADENAFATDEELMDVMEKAAANLVINGR